MARKRTARNSHFSQASLLVPFDCLDFGDPEKDPCFGKHYDLLDDTCLSCGDIEWCSTIFNQRLTKKRLEEEKKGSNYDLKIDALEFDRDVRSYYDMELIECNKPFRARHLTAKRFQTTRTRIKTIINGHEGPDRD
jgi:hypothetical protein